MTVSGFSILFARFILVLHYQRKRSWHLSQIQKSTKLKSRKITIKIVNEILEELSNERKEARVCESQGYCQNGKPF